MTPIDDATALRCVTHHACDCINATAEGARELIERYGSDAIVRATDLLRWAEMYGEHAEYLQLQQLATQAVAEWQEATGVDCPSSLRSHQRVQDLIAAGHAFRAQWGLGE